MKKIVAKRKLRERVTHGELAPPTTQRAPVIKLRKKPRGRPFKKGNKYGLASRFRQGEPSANPEGRPSYKKQNEACREQLAAVVPLHELHAAKLPAHLIGRTYAEVNAWVMEQEGMRGNISALAEIADRAEGRPGVAASSVGEVGPIDLLIASMEQYHSEHFGVPEGHVPLKEFSEDEEANDESGAPAENFEKH
jgi:hypothetical protein